MEVFGDPNHSQNKLHLQDPDAPDVGVATDSQFLLQLDNATLGTDFAQKTYSKAWLKAEDLRCVAHAMRLAFW